MLLLVHPKCLWSTPRPLPAGSPAFWKGCVAVLCNLSPLSELSLSPLLLTAPSSPLLWPFPHPLCQRSSWHCPITDAARWLREQGVLPGRWVDFGAAAPERSCQRDGAEACQATPSYGGVCLGAAGRDGGWELQLGGRKVMAASWSWSCAAQCKQQWSSLCGTRETQAFGSPFGWCCNHQCNKLDGKAGATVCLGIWGLRHRKNLRVCSDGLCGKEDVSVPTVSSSCYQAMAGFSFSWVTVAVCGSVAFKGLTVGHLKARQHRKGKFFFFFFGKVVGWAVPRKVVSCSPVGRAKLGPYLQPPQKSPELCSFSLRKRGFRSCDSLAVWRRLLYPAVKPVKFYYWVRQAMEEKEQCG